jgi:hypothetical protein
MKTSQILHRYYRKTLTEKSLVKWAESLLSEGFESDDVFLLLSEPDLHFLELPKYVERMCREFGFCQDFSDPRAAFKKVSLDEYKKGVLSGPELIFHFDEIRQQSGFPEHLTWYIKDDEPDGTNLSGLCSDETKTSGQALEVYVDKYLAKINLC